MNALSLYVSTCRMVLQSGADDASAWANISRLLSCLRQALTCCVCEKILSVPTSSNASTCHHHVCKNCIGGKKRLKPACARCSDYSLFTENNQIQILLQCYKKLCEYIKTSACHRKWGNLNGGSTANLADLVQEGTEISGDYQPRSSNSTEPLKMDLDSAEESGSSTNRCATNGDGSLYSVTVAGNSSTKIMIKRTATDDSESESNTYDKQGVSGNFGMSEGHSKRVRVHRSKRKCYSHSTNNNKQEFSLYSDKERERCEEDDDDSVNDDENEEFLTYDSSDESD